VSARILIVDDDDEMADTVAEYLASRGHAAECAVGGKAALAALKKRRFDAVITDLRMEHVDGLDVLEASRRDDPTRPVLIMTAFGTIDGALEAVRKGAFHYLTKPFRMDEVLLWVERALAERGLKRENAQLKKLAAEHAGYHGLVGTSAAMRKLCAVVERAAHATMPVLITGESGTGKELVARALHQDGSRASRPFVAVSCAAIAHGLLEAELFGHARGAFTGAVEARPGLFVEAEGGTLLLDEIGELPLALQSKLLRALESGAVRPVGGGPERAVDVRIVAATNRDLGAAVKAKEFREDLYYRLRVVPIETPPLRARREDVPLLARHFAARFAERHPDEPRRELGADVLRRLAELPWPGNVRELKNAVERLLLYARGRRVELRDLAGIVAEPLPEAMAGVAAEVVPLRVMTRRYVEWVLEQTGGNKARTAQLLGIDASTIYRMLARDDDDAAG
jgi:two-component system, NtrC family, response regulator HydG